jgi:hypothetical protein
MPAIRWSNGYVDKASTWQDLLDGVRMSQWNGMPEDEFRAVLASRAYRWSLTKVDPDLDVADLFVALRDAHLIEIIDSEEDD